MHRQAAREYRKSSITIVMLVAGVLGITSSCKEDHEAGGAHGDRDLAMEESFQDEIDLPPYISDPLQIEAALRANPESPYFGWSHIPDQTEDEVAGHVYLATNGTDKFKMNLDLSGAEQFETVNISLSEKACTASVEPADLTVLGKIPGASHATRRNFEIKFSASQLPNRMNLRACHRKDVYLRVSDEERILACEKLDCIERPAE